jgi:integrase
MSCPSGLEGAGRKRTPAMGQRAALPPYAVETLRAGAGPVVVQKLLGHASLSTNQRYVDHLEREDLRQWAFSSV